MSFKPLAQVFFFDSFSVDAHTGEVAFQYSTDAGHHFTHVVTYAFPPGTDTTALAPAIFALGMAEIPGYWKVILSPKIVVQAGALAPEQVAFWENAFTKGLGEFFFENKIDFRNLVHIESDQSAPVLTPRESTGAGALVLFGGGKDSLVTGELLKKQHKPFSWFELEPLPFSQKLRELSGVTDTVQVGRSVQRNFAPVIELVKQGAPNGHVPITATYIFSAVLAALLTGKRDVIASLERSANVGNVEYLGQNINHQYSKSFESEQAIAAYVQAYVAPHLRVFSLIRPWYEIQIVQRFCEFPEYHSVFVSCNRGLKTGTWCGECAKCAFMFAALSAFLSPEHVVAIFKKNLFADEALLPLYRDMVGLGGMKPFDCVGTFEENVLALYLSGEQYATAGMSLPAILAKLPIAEGKKYLALLADSGSHAIPSDYA